MSKNIFQRQIQFFGSATEQERLGLKPTSFYKRYSHLGHFAHYETAWQIFRDYPISGVQNLDIFVIIKNILMPKSYVLQKDVQLIRIRFISKYYLNKEYWVT